MKSIKNTLLLIAVMLFSIPSMAYEMSQDEARECVSAYIDKLKQHFGTNNSIITN